MDRVGEDGPVPAHQIALEVQLVDVAQLREGVHPLLVELADGAMRGVHPARIRLQVVDLPRHELRGILLPVPVGRVVRTGQAAVAALRVQAARVHAELHAEVVHLLFQPQGNVKPRPGPSDGVLCARPCHANGTVATAPLDPTACGTSAARGNIIGERRAPCRSGRSCSGTPWC